MSPTGPKSSSRPIKAAGCGGDLSCYVISNKTPSDTDEVTYPGPGSRRDTGGQADYDLTPGAIRHLPSGAGDGGTMQEAGASTQQVESQCPYLVCPHIVILDTGQLGNSR